MAVSEECAELVLESSSQHGGEPLFKDRLPWAVVLPILVNICPHIVPSPQVGHRLPHLGIVHFRRSCDKILLEVFGAQVHETDLAYHFLEIEKADRGIGVEQVDNGVNPVGAAPTRLALTIPPARTRLVVPLGKISLVRVHTRRVIRERSEARPLELAVARRRETVIQADRPNRVVPQIEVGDVSFRVGVEPVHGVSGLFCCVPELIHICGATGFQISHPSHKISALECPPTCICLVVL